MFFISTEVEGEWGSGQWAVGERGKGWKWEWENRYVIDHYLSVHHLHTGHTCRVLETY